MKIKWQILFSCAPNITADGDCSHGRLLLGRRAMTKLDSVLKSKDITSPTKVCLVKAMVFTVVMYGMWELDHKEGWVSKNWRFWTVVLPGRRPGPPVSFQAAPLSVGLRLSTPGFCSEVWPPSQPASSTPGLQQESRLLSLYFPGRRRLYSSPSVRRSPNVLTF